MDESGGDPSTAVTLFLDNGELYVSGDTAAIDHVLGELLVPDDRQRRRAGITKLSDAGAVGTSVAAMHAASEELLRPTAASLAKLREFGAQLDEGGALRGFVRGDGGKFSGQLAFESVSSGAEQALALQSAAVSLALRSAIADVQAAVEAVDEKVTDIQKRVRAREIGEVVGTYRFLKRVVDATRKRGRLLDADWDQVAGTRADLEKALDSLRAYVTELVNEVDADQPLPKREKAIRQIADPKGVAGSLRLILVAQQALHLMEYLRLERVRTTDPEHVASALADARHSLRVQSERDALLVRTASERIEAAKRIDPLEVHRIFSIPDMREAAAKALDTVEAFAAASRVDLPELDKDVQRPQLAETRAAVKQQAVTAKDTAVDASRTVRRAATQRRKLVSESVRHKVKRRKSGSDGSAEEIEPGT